jgi:hypothetical protein
MKVITGILIFAVLSTSVQAQRACSSEEYKNRLIQNNPVLNQAMQAAELQIAQTLKNDNGEAHRDTSANELINIPVVVHIVYNTPAQNVSDAQILSQLAVLNNDFSNGNADRTNRPLVFDNVAANVRIRFCIAQVAPDGRPSKGIIRKQTNTALFSADDAVKNNMRGGDDAWDCKKYLNIWVCNLGGRTLGYASLPGGPADVDGVVIGFDVFGAIGNLRPQFNKGRTLTHEVGHWLGVKHIWGDTECGNDDVDDTPRQLTYNFGCPSFPRTTSCSESTDGDMYMNFMDFSDDDCMNMFTIGQKKRMRALFATGNLRNSFLESFACDSTLVQGGPVGGDTANPLPVVKANAFKIYPNPVAAFLTLEYKAASAFVAKPYSLYNMLGVKVTSGELTKEKSFINLAFLHRGIYIVRIGDGEFTAKIFKQ